MSEQIILQEPRYVISEPGLGIHVGFGPESVYPLQKQMQAGLFSITNAYIEPVGGYLMGQPLFGVEATTSTDWETTGDNWTSDVDTPRFLFDPFTGTKVAGMSYHATGEDWTLTSREAFPAGAPLLMQFATFDRTYQNQEERSGERLTVEFGSYWKLRLFATGRALLDKKQIIAPALVTESPTYEWETVSSFDWMVGQWAPSQHWLWIYEVGANLIIRNVSGPTDGEYRGTLYQDKAPVTDPETNMKHALGEGYVRFSGEGYIAIGCSRQKFEKGDDDESTSWFAQTYLSSVGLANEGSTQPVIPYVWGLRPDGTTPATVTVFDQNFAAWPTIATVFGPNTGLSWNAQWQTSALTTSYISAFDIIVPQTQVLSPGSGTDILALSGVADRNISVTREGDLTRERSSVEVFTYGTPLAAYVQPNMTYRYVSDGVTRFLGYTSGADWNTEADLNGDVVGVLSLEADGLWSRFKRSLWPGGAAFDGQRLTDVLVKLAEAAGLNSTLYEIVDDPWVIPGPLDPEADEPANYYRPGTSIDRILEDLRENFFGLWLRMYFRLTDGKFVVEYTTSYTSFTPASISAYFYETNDAATAALSPWQVILAGSYKETLDQSEQYNVVTVMGQSKNKEPLVAKAVDWASIRDSSVFNWVGEPWYLIVADPGFQDQGSVNWVCRSLFDRHRNPKVYAEWSSIRVDLQPDDYVQLVGPGYGSIYKIKGVRLAKGNSGDEADPMGRAVYSAEKVIGGVIIP